MRTTQAIINLDSFIQNLQNIRTFLKPKTTMCIPVKADGYGHGAVQIAKTALSCNCNVSHLAVAAVSEAIELRNAGITSPIIMFSIPSPNELDEVAEYDIQPFIFDEEQITQINNAAQKKGKTVSVHLAIDTGMGRIGCRPENAVSIAKSITSHTNLKLAGVCTHFAVSDSVRNDDRLYTKQQLKKFSDAVNQIKAAGINPGIVHCANSGAILMHPDAEFDMVRPGIIIYGYFPDKGIAEYCENEIHHPINLTPIMSFQTHICAIKTVNQGESISYGRTWIADKTTDIATIPVGYADGLLRTFATQKEPITVSINGNKYPIVGRICMDQCMINIGQNNNVKRWDEVVIFGYSVDNKSKSIQNAENIADLVGTISYEILCGIAKRVPRIYKGYIS